MPVTLDQFIQNLISSGLMTAEEVSAVQRGLPPDKRPKDAQALARLLHQQGKLAKYHRADVYSLGCTLHCLLTGAPPFSGDTTIQILLAHQQAPIPSLCDARPDVASELDACRHWWRCRCGCLVARVGVRHQRPRA